MPVTMPGSAIGSTAMKLTALRPKNRWRVSANDGERAEHQRDRRREQRGLDASGTARRADPDA